MNFINSLLLEGGGFLDGFTNLFGGKGGKSGSLPIIIMVVVFLGIYFLLFILPQQRKRKQTESMLNNIKKGDKVVTIGGIHGKVVTAKEGEITIRVDSNAEITFDKSAISKVLNATQTSDNNKQKDDTK